MFSFIHIIFVTFCVNFLVHCEAQIVVPINAGLHTSAKLPCYSGRNSPVFFVRLEVNGEMLYQYFPELNITKTKDADKYVLDKNTLNIAIVDVEIGDAGEYLCYNQIDDHSEEKYQITLNVYAPPTEVRISSDHSAIDEGQNHPVTCDVPSVYPSETVAFYIESGQSVISGPLEAEYSANSDETFRAIATSPLTFDRRYNEEKIRCKVVYSYGEREKDTRWSTELHVNINYCDKPQICGSTKIDGDISITCSTTCSPVRDITLYQYPDIPLYGVSGTELKTEIATQHDDATFYCAVNYMDGIMSDNLTYSALRKVSFSPVALEMKRNESDYVLSWPHPEGKYTHMVVTQCPPHRKCVMHDVTDLTHKMVNVSEGTQFMLYTYYDTGVVSCGAFLLSQPHFKGNDTPSKVPIGLSVLLVLGSLVAVSGLIIIVWRVHRCRFQKRKDKTDHGSGSIDPRLLDDNHESDDITSGFKISASKNRDGNIDEQTPLQIITHEPEKSPPNNFGNDVVYKPEVQKDAPPLSLRSDAKLECVLPCSQEFYDSKKGDPEVYEMTGNPRGYAVIINVTVNREGAKTDQDNLANLFKDLKYEIITYKDYKKQDLLEALMRIAKNPALEQHNSIIVFIMAHGQKDEVFDVNHKPLRLSYIFDIFDRDNCSALRGKPKLFFIQACRGVGDDVVVWDDEPDTPLDTVDGPMFVPSAMVAEQSDIIKAYATVEGMKAARKTVSGSTYVTALVNVFKKFAKDCDILRLLTKVNNEVQRLCEEQKTFDGKLKAITSSMQCPPVESTLRKEFYFFPGY